METKPNWIDEQVAECDQLLGTALSRDTHAAVIDFLRAKLLESYKNGAAAARRRRFTGEKPHGRMERYERKERGA